MYLPVRVSLTDTNKNWLKPQHAKFSPLASPEGWGGNCPDSAGKFEGYVFLPVRNKICRIWVTVII